MQPPKEPLSVTSTLQKRPTTPGRSSTHHSKEAEYTTHSKKEKENHKERESKRSSLSFLRRSKSSDRSQKPIMPNIPQQPPRIPELWAAGASPPYGEETNVRDSVDIISGTLGIPGMSPSRKSTDTGVSGVSSALGSSSAPVKSSGRDSASDNATGVSMAHRGRYSYASSAVSTVNPPRRVRRRKDPTPFNILVIGAKNSGKTSFIQFLRQSLALKPKKADQVDDQQEAKPPNAKSPFVRTYLETEIDGERIGLTLWDSQGLERNIVDLQLRETTAFIESKFEETFTEETKVIRAPGVRDTHIHCAFHLLDPAHLESSILRASSSGTTNGNGIISGGLDEDIDVQVLRALKGKTTMVPVISKADTITTAHMNVLKNLVRVSLRRAGLDPLEALDLDLEAYGITPSLTSGIMAGPFSGRDGVGNRIEEEDEEGTEEEDENKEGRSYGSATGNTPDEDVEDANLVSRTHRRTISRVSHASSSTSSTNAMSNIDFLPLSIISPDSYEPGAIGRKFPWGFADPYNAEHCDFERLKDVVFSEWRGELREASREMWYENWRTSRLSGGNGGRKSNGVVRRR